MAGEAPLHERVWDLSLCSTRGCHSTWHIIPHHLALREMCLLGSREQPGTVCAGLVSQSWGWWHHTDSWRTRPIPGGAVSILESNDAAKGQGGQWDMEYALCFWGGQQTAEEPCASQPGARHGKGEAGPIIVLIVLIPVLFGKCRDNAFVPGEA